jgi:hypothetical protein
MDKNFRAATGRQVRQGFAELRATDKNEFALVGYAATYNSWSKDLGGFREQIKPGAFTRSLQAKADVKCLFNHSADHILGRTKSGTLTLTDTPRGLQFRCQLDKDSQKHQDVYAAVSRGDISECSFAFTVAQGGQSWTEGMDPDTNQRTQFRTLTDVDLIDVSVVTYPAYNETDAQARAAAKVNVTHGIIEAVAYLRKAAQSVVRAIFNRADSSPVDFGSRLGQCHEQAELCCMMAERCYEDMGDDEDGDPDDEVLKASFRMASAGLKLASEHFATARFRHASNVSKMQQAKVLGRGR